MHPTLVFYSVYKHQSIFLCLTPNDFTRQVESAATQWVKWPGILKFITLIAEPDFPEIRLCYQGRSLYS
jgi:hypothetical protein